MGMRRKTIVTILTTTGPVVVQMIRRYWPAIREAIERNPELLQQAQDQLQRLATIRRAEHDLESIRQRLSILREQVAYLQSSADDDAEARQAVAFRSQLDRFEVSLATTNAASTSKVRKRDLRLVSKRLDRLTERILLAFVEERASDSPRGITH